MEPDKKALKALHDLVATCNDAVEGFAKAAKGARDKDLSNWLAQASVDREGFASQLSSAIKKMGDLPGVDVHEGGILHKGWVDLEQEVRSKDDAEIIRQCIAGDSGSVDHYDHALAQEFGEDLRLLLIEQRTAIEDNLIYLESKVEHQEVSGA